MDHQLDLHGVRDAEPPRERAPPAASQTRTIHTCWRGGVYDRCADRPGQRHPPFLRVLRRSPRLERHTANSRGLRRRFSLALLLLDVRPRRHRQRICYRKDAVRADVVGVYLPQRGVYAVDGHAGEGARKRGYFVGGQCDDGAAGGDMVCGVCGVREGGVEGEDCVAWEG